jgi:hypothetical protein
MKEFLRIENRDVFLEEVSFREVEAEGLGRIGIIVHGAKNVQTGLPETLSEAARARKEVNTGRSPPPVPPNGGRHGPITPDNPKPSPSLSPAVQFGVPALFPSMDGAYGDNFQEDSLEWCAAR